MTVVLPIRAVSVSNVREHWAKRAKRAREHRGIAALVCAAELRRPDLPVIVRLTRIAPRPLDSHDNLRASTKAVVDGIADWLGIDDRDPRVTWEYRQEKGKPKTYSVRVEVANAGPLALAAAGLMVEHLG